MSLEQIDEQRVLGILMAFPAMADKVKREWFVDPINRRIYGAIVETNSGEVHELVAKLQPSEDGVRYLIGLSELCWAPENLEIFSRSMRCRVESRQFAQSMQKLVVPSKGGRMFADIGRAHEKSEVRA